MPKIPSLLIKAPAKINLSLAVGEKFSRTPPSPSKKKHQNSSEFQAQKVDYPPSPEASYHEIRTILQEIPLADELTFSSIRKSEIIIECSDPNVPTDANNLIYRAIELLRSQNPEPRSWPGLHITLQKNIPVAAGLGGGSSDAAATLKALNQLWNLQLTPNQLRDLAANIGMDVPFFIEGGTALGSHFGERIENLPPLQLPPLLLIIPRHIRKLSTAENYRRLENYPQRKNFARHQQLLATLPKETRSQRQERFENFPFELLENDFEVLYRPKMDSLVKKLYEKGARAVHLAGSGPAWYALFPERMKLHETLAAFKKSPTLEFSTCSFLSVESA